MLYVFGIEDYGNNFIIEDYGNNFIISARGQQTSDAA